MKKRLAIVTTHPIQYNAPWFRLLTERNRITLKVFYTWSQSAAGKKYDPGFKRDIEWDIPLLEGYDYSFVENTSPSPGTRHYSGIQNPGLVKELDAFKPDAILVSGWNFKSHLHCLRHYHKKIPVLFRGDSTMLDETGGLKSVARRLVLKWVFRHINYALYTGQANKQYFKAHGLTEAQLVFTPHAIDNDRFAGDPSQQSAAIALRQQLGIGEEEFVFLFAGKFEPKKSPELLISSFMAAGLSGAHLVMVGNGELEQELKNLAEDNRNIHFMDFQNQANMPSVYDMADLVVLPSAGPGETWGLAVNEAMASGKAVIVSDKCGCAADLVQENVNGWLFRANDAAGLTNVIRSVPLRKDVLAAMGNAGQKMISRYSFRQIAEAIETTVQVTI
ncbi:MAG: glycosyltransferase family 4 protein [Ferruginibacter sp.]